MIGAALTEARAAPRTGAFLALPDVCLARDAEPRTLSGPTGTDYAAPLPSGFERLARDDDGAGERKALLGASIADVLLCPGRRSERVDPPAGHVRRPGDGGAGLGRRTIAFLKDSGKPALDGGRCHLEPRRHLTAAG